eukprot:GEMP01037687.1.p1 GENE.GEMP01037687.1~~GEMP01037687.1.p1  ORF type:complete len:370 (+),score=51.91 GEMP01037687.1:30-1112(+)
MMWLFLAVAWAFYEPPGLVSENKRSVNSVRIVAPPSCATLSPGPITIILVSPHDTCIDVYVRSTTAELWYFDIPPPLEPITVSICTSRRDDKGGYSFSAELDLVKGFVRLSVVQGSLGAALAFYAVGATASLTKAREMHRKDLHYAASLRAKYGRKKYDFLGDFTGNWWAPHPLPAVLDSAKLITPVSSKGGAYFLQNAIPAHVREQLMKESLNALRYDFKAPNDMNNKGVILEELPINVDPVVDWAVEVGRHFYPNWIWHADRHHIFTIHYKPGKGEDIYLPLHFDQCELTISISLNPGNAVVHLGQQFHGTTNITDGLRINLIVRLLDTSFRRSPTDGLVSRCPYDDLNVEHDDSDEL